MTLRTHISFTTLYLSAHEVMQPNPFMITAVGGYEKDRELNADELVVLKQKLRAFRQAFIVYMIAEPDKQKHAERNRNILIKLHEFDLNFDAPLKLKRKKRAEVVVFVNEQKLLDAEKYGKDVAQKAKAFLRYWENHALPGKQV